MDILKTEITKLAYKKSTKVLGILYITALLFGILIYIGAESILGFTLYNQLQFVGAGLSVMMNFLLPLMALFLASSMITIDYAKGTIKNMYLLPIHKDKIFVGKIAAVQVVLAAILVVQFLITTLVAWVMEGIQFKTLMGFFGQYIGAFVVLLMVNLIGHALTLLLKNTGIVIIMAYTLYTVLGIASLYIPVIKSISISHLIGSYSEFFNGGNVFLLLSVIAYYIILFIAGLLLFDKKEEYLCQFD